jgi:hypothetical protein
MDPSCNTLNAAFATSYDTPSIETSIDTDTLLSAGMMQEIVVVLKYIAACSMY